MFLRAVKIITIATISSIIAASRAVDDNILDPSLYLSPSPPLRLTSGSLSPEETWSRSFDTRTERVIRDVSPIPETTEITTPVATGRMFWPRFSRPEPIGINIPLSFSLSGTYGKFAVPSGVIGNAYTSVSNHGTTLIGKPIPAGITGVLGKTAAAATVYGNYGSALAGSSYGAYGKVRVYGSDNVPAWSGWGNGKWGHYGKG